MEYLSGKSVRQIIEYFKGLIFLLLFIFERNFVEHYLKNLII